MGESTLSVGIVGCGIGREHAKAYVEIPDLYEIKAFCDIDEAKADKLAQEYGTATIYTTYDELLADDGIDVVDICTPPHLHFSQSVAALKAGKQVICEKPLVESLERVDQLKQIEAGAKGMLMPIFQNRFGHGYQKMLHLVKTGITGKAFLTTVELTWYRGAAYYAVDWRGKWATERGGCLLIHGIHSLDLCLALMGKPVKVKAMTTTRVNPIETEDCAVLAVEMESGALLSISVTLGSVSERSRIRTCWSNVSAESAHATHDHNHADWTFEARSPEVAARIEEALRNLELAPSAYVGQFTLFHKAIHGGGEPPITIDDARNVIALLTAVYASAHSGGEKALPIERSDPLYKDWVPESFRTKNNA